MVADTKSLIIAYVKELNIRNLYREGKNTDNLYKCSVIADTNVADTVTPLCAYFDIYIYIHILLTLVSTQCMA